MINVQRLLNLMSHLRPSGAPATVLWFKSWLLNHSKFPWEFDTHGNAHLTIGFGSPEVLWTSHYDTVDLPGAVDGTPLTCGLKTITLAGDYCFLDPAAHQPAACRCLGADDAAGVELILTMVEHGVPGLYMLCADEEIGRRGSLGAAKDGIPHSITHCVSLDRAGTRDLVDTQSMGQTTASSMFLMEFTKRLGLPMQAATGSYTDSLSFYDVGVTEATNVSVGYSHQHTRGEMLDLRHLNVLAISLCKSGAGFSGMPVANSRPEACCDADVADIVYDTPEITLDFIMDYGLDKELVEYAKEYQDGKKETASYYDRMWGQP